MKIILLSDSLHKTGSRSFSLPLLMGFLLLMFLVAAAGATWAGYRYGLETQVAARGEAQANGVLLRLTDEQRHDLSETRERTREHIDALALRLGQLQSHVLRLDALGERLVERGGLDADEFNFSDVPSRGGAAPATGEASSIDARELIGEMGDLAQALEDREHKLTLMEGLLADKALYREITPAGRPVKKGWISSPYGYRKDPKTGKRDFHHGVDVASKENSDVIAVAAGVVTWVGEKSGYGILVELRHADGYTTRYGHNNKALVQAGDMVAKGQVIALVGSTGRSTGPHVHFEIARGGKALNPHKYLKMVN
ncbi:MAG: M23 family metallopeptidase [gamma proteobacterium symbiont of Phacoides pectinatus]